MSRQVLPIIGAVVGGVIGYYTGGPSGAVTGAQYGFTIGAIAGPIVDPLIIQGQRVGDNQLQIAAEGGARAIVFGQGCVNATCVIARGDRKVIKKRESGGKGSGSKTENEYVYWTFAIGLGEASIGSSIVRVWQDENLVYDIRENGQRSSEDNAAFAAKFRFYDGSETQLPDPALQAFLGEDTPYFRGTAYVVFSNFDLTNTAERIPVFKFEIAAASPPIQLAGPVNSFAVGGVSSGGYFVPQEYYEEIAFNANSNVATPVFLAQISFAPNNGQIVSGSLYVKINGAVVYAGNFATQTSLFFFSLQINHAVNSDIVRIGFVTTQAFSGGYSIHLNAISSSNIYEPIANSNGIVPSIYKSSDAQFGVLKKQNVFYRASYIDYFTEMWRVSNFYSSQTVAGGNNFSLANLVAALLQRAGMRQSEFDVNELDDMVVGAVIQETITGADAVGSVLTAYFADPTEYDGKLRFIKRGKNVLRTLTIDDLVEEPEVASRENVVEYPAKLHLFYQSPKTGYALTKATSNRYSPNAEVVGEGSVTIPITFDDSTEPANIAAKLHKTMWNEAGGDFAWTVGDHCIDIVPTDTLGLNLRGVVTRVRVTAMELQPGKIKLVMRKDRQSSYTANVTAIPLPEPTTPPPSTVSKAILAVMDIPALMDSDDALYYYSAMSGTTQAWRGGQLQQSMDGGATWAAVSEVTVNVPMGRLAQIINAASPHYPDNTNVIKFQLFDPQDQLDDLTQQQWLSENGAIAVQNADGTWEIMQYRDANDEGDGLYTLSMLQRGRLNTGAVEHAVNALVVVLDNAVQRQAAQSAWINTTLHHRGVSYGTSPELADNVDTLYKGNSQREWPVASFDVNYYGGKVYVNNIVPCHRFGTEDSPVRSTNWSGYRITAYVLRESDNLTFIYYIDTTESFAVLDVSSLPAQPHHVSVGQVNRITGEGAKLTKEVAVANNNGILSVNGNGLRIAFALPLTSAGKIPILFDNSFALISASQNSASLSRYEENGDFVETGAELSIGGQIIANKYGSTGPTIYNWSLVKTTGAQYQLYASTGVNSNSLVKDFGSTVCADLIVLGTSVDRDVYISQPNNDSIVVIDGASSALLRTFFLSGNPTKFDVWRNGNSDFLIVLCSGSSEVVLVNVYSSDTQTARWSCISNPTEIRYFGNKIFVANSTQLAIYEIDGTLFATHNFKPVGMYAVTFDASTLRAPGPKEFLAIGDPENQKVRFFNQFYLGQTNYDFYGTIDVADLIGLTGPINSYNDCVYALKTTGTSAIATGFWAGEISVGIHWGNYPQGITVPQTLIFNKTGTINLVVGGRPNESGIRSYIYSRPSLYIAKIAYVRVTRQTGSGLSINSGKLFDTIYPISDQIAVNFFWPGIGAYPTGTALVEFSDDPTMQIVRTSLQLTWGV